ncbi:MAG: hypothetical protein NTY11_01040 [Candidatus Parcubacteria bacterium]|nr:hypothetical protein [Candidatus Parcubacteria bacterium]
MKTLTKPRPAIPDRLKKEKTAKIANTIRKMPKTHGLISLGKTSPFPLFLEKRDRKEGFLDALFVIALFFLRLAILKT